MQIIFLLWLIPCAFLLGQGKNVRVYTGMKIIIRAEFLGYRFINFWNLEMDFLNFSIESECYGEMSLPCKRACLLLSIIAVVEYEKSNNYSHCDFWQLPNVGKIWKFTLSNI